jgi:hypothetical protein
LAVRSDAVAERVDSGQYRPTASVQLPHEWIPASSACHGDPRSRAGEGARLADGSRPETSADGFRGVREQWFVVPEDIDDLYVVGSCIASMAVRVGCQRWRSAWSAPLQDVKNRFGFHPQAQGSVVL